MTTAISQPDVAAPSAENSEPTDAKSQATKRTIFVVLLALVMVISWVGILDAQSESYIDGSLKQALVAYGVARGVNAVVSVLQTFHILSLGVGEVLDPINDLVERFSSVMELAIGSLFIQKILLEITSSLFFKVALTASGSLLILSLFVRTGINTLLLSRVFISLVFIRFSISLVVVLNGMVAAAFVTDKIDTEVAVVAAVEKTAPVPEAPNLEEAVQPSSPAEAPAQSDSAPVAAVTPAPEPEKKGFFGGMGEVLKDAAVKAKEMGGKTVATVKEMAKKWNPKALKEKLDQVIPQMLNLMALFLLKTIILPLLFLYGFKYVLQQVWNIGPFSLYTGKPRLILK